MKEISSSSLLLPLQRRHCRLYLAAAGDVVAAGIAPPANFLDEEPEPFPFFFGERRRDLAEELLLDFSVGQAL